MSARRIVLLAGVSGVGKTTTLKDATRRLAFVHLQAGEIIKFERQERQDKRHDIQITNAMEINDNQALLISGFMRCAPKEGLIVLDGHTVIDTINGLVEISPAVFSAIGVSRFVVLIDDVEKIALRRLSDTKRMRPIRSIEELAEHQERSLLSAYRAALTLGVPVYAVPMSHILDVSNFIII